MTALVAASSCIPFAQHVAATRSFNPGVNSSGPDRPSLAGNIMSPRTYLLASISSAEPVMASRNVRSTSAPVVRSHLLGSEGSREAELRAYVPISTGNPASTSGDEAAASSIELPAAIEIGTATDAEAQSSVGSRDHPYSPQASPDGASPSVIAGGAAGSAQDPGPAAPGSQQGGEPIAPDRRAGPFAEPSPLLSSPGPQVKTLQQALARTYQTNPNLMARRAELRGLDSAVAFESAAGKPQIVAGATLDQELHTTRPLGTRGRNLSATAEVSQILFAGGRIRNSVRAARTRVIAGRADLRATEGDLLTEAVEAYADVLRDREIRDLNLAQVRSLQANLESTRARFAVRDLTLTDVAQSEARLDGVQSNLATAEGRLQSSEENFERVVGARAGALEPLPPLPPLPMTSDQAVEATLANNADIAAFVARARAADHEVAATKSARLPSLAVVSTTEYDNALGTADSASGLPAGTLPNSSTNIRAGLSLRFPLYQGGAVSARVRQAEEFRARQVEEAIAVERLVVANARTAFSIWRSALTAISFNELAVVANEQALQSVKVEQTVGARSILDVLNAEQELLSSRIELATARRDAYVAAFDLLNTMGAAEAADLNLDAGPLYDPRVNYRTYSDSWSDWADGARRPPASTRNVSAETDSPVTRLNKGTLDETELND